MKSKLARWGREGLLLAALLAAVLFAMDKWRAPQLSQALSSTVFQTLDGRHVTLSSLSAERPLLLYFWASWCAVCRYTTPDVARLVASGENVMTIALRSGSDQDVARWLSRKALELPVVNDPSGELARLGQVGVTPTVVVLNKGAVVTSTTGWTSYWGMKLRLWWAGV